MHSGVWSANVSVHYGFLFVRFECESRRVYRYVRCVLNLYYIHIGLVRFYTYIIYLVSELTDIQCHIGWHIEGNDIYDTWIFLIVVRSTVRRYSPFLYTLLLASPSPLAHSIVLASNLLPSYLLHHLTRPMLLYFFSSFRLPSTLRQFAWHPSNSIWPDQARPSMHTV